VHRNLDAQNSHSQPGTAEFALTNARKNSLLVSNEVESTAVSNAKKVDPWGGDLRPLVQVACGDSYEMPHFRYAIRGKD
jgi:hypothetical protein